MRNRENNFNTSNNSTRISTSNSTQTVPFDAKQYHTSQLHNFINDFYDYASIGNYIENQNKLLNTYLEVVLKNPDAEQIKDVVHFTSTQIAFISELKNKFDKFLLFNPLNVK